MKKIITIILFIISVMLSCERDNNQFPQVSVNINIYTNNPEFFSVNTPGGWIYLNGGVGGVLLYRKSFDEFIAYDRASPFNPTDECKIEVNEDNIIISDPCSESLFLITDGSVIQGPATYGLYRYNTYFDGQNLSIYN